MKKTASFLYYFFFSCLLFSVTALAYIDPSAMTYMIQLIAGVAIAAGAGASYYFRRFKRRFSRRDQGRSRAAVQSYEEDDDDDTGYGDYELEPSAQEQQAPAPAAEAASARTLQAAQAQPAPEAPAYANDAVSAAIDPYDETGGTAGLIAENRELRRLLAQERQNVEELKRALHICTAPRK